MSKIYLIAVDWEGVEDNPLASVSIYDAPTGTDIGRFTTYKPVDKWRIYAFATKKARDDLMRRIIDKKGAKNDERSR